MLNQLDRIISSADGPVGVSNGVSGMSVRDIYSGRYYFDHALGSLHMVMDIAKIPDNAKAVQMFFGKTIDDIREVFDEQYKKFYANYYTQLGHYFRYVYNIIKFVRQSDLNDEEQRRYINILQAQLSNTELGLIFYNALSKNARNKEGKYQFYEWLEEYNFL